MILFGIGFPVLLLGACGMGVWQPVETPAGGGGSREPVTGKGPKAESKLPSKDYQLVWSDEFDGADGAAPDASKWGYWLIGKQGEQVNWTDGARLDGHGNLKMQTTRHEVYDKRGKRSIEYRAAFLSTEGKYETAYGYFEARMKFQKEVGHWSAFWINSSTLGKPRKDPARAGVEIDIIEYMTNPEHRDQAMHTIHWDNKTPDHKQDHAMVKVPGLSDGWHLVGCEWTEEAIVFYVDGKETYRTSKAIPKREQYMVLSMHVGDWAGRIMDAQLPDACLVDHVRVYKRAGGHAASVSSVPNESVVAEYLKKTDAERKLAAVPGTGVGPLSKADAAAWREAAWKAYRRLDTQVGLEAKKVVEAGKVVSGAVEMPYATVQTGAKPATGWPLVIGLHDKPAAGLKVEDAWHLQQGKQVYQGLYVCPKSPGDGSWTDPAVPGMLDRLLDAMVIVNGVDPSRVVVTGTGDGAAAAMRWAFARPDRFAGVAVAGGVVEATGSAVAHAVGLPMRVSVGDQDSGTLAKARAWASLLGSLGATSFELDEQAGRGKGVSTAGLPGWASARVRTRAKVTMLAPSAEARRVGWAEVDSEWIVDAERASVVVSAGDQKLEVTAQGVKRVRLLLDDEDMDLERPIEIVVNGKSAWAGRVDRSAATIVRGMARFGDVGLVPMAEVEVDVGGAGGGNR